jgi:hypothetical protein
MAQRVLLRDPLPYFWIGILLLVMLIMFAISEFAFARHPGFMSDPALACRAAYAHARTAQDSAVVDAQTVTEGRARVENALSCGAMRRSGELR